MSTFKTPSGYEYSWNQEQDKVVIIINVDEETQQDDLEVDIKNKRLKIVNNNQDQIKIIEGELFGEIDASSYEFKLEEQKIVIDLRKLNGDVVWEQLFKPPSKLPVIFQLAEEKRIKEIIKLFKQAKAREDGGDEEGDHDDEGEGNEPKYTLSDLIHMKHPETQHNILMWATLSHEIDLIEFLLKQFDPKTVIGFQAEQEFEIIKEWQTERKRLQELEKKKLEGKEEEEENEDDEEEHKDFAESLHEKFESFTVEKIKEIGEVGIYEGETAEFEVPLPPEILEMFKPQEPPKPMEESKPLEEAVKEEKENDNENKEQEEEENKDDEEENEEDKDEEDEENNEDEENDEEEKKEEEDEEKKPKVREPPKPQVIKYRNGSGKAYYPNDDMYVGQFTETVREGMGTYIYRGTYIESGKKPEEEEDEDEKEELNPSNVPLCFYTGHWIQNKKHGKGKMIYHNGDSYEGDFNEDKKETPHGIYYYVNGDTYVGAFKNDLKEGEGTYKFSKDGSRLIGTWKEGKFVKGDWMWKEGVVFSSNDFSQAIIEGTFSFPNYKAKGFFSNGRWNLSQIISK